MGSSVFISHTHVDKPFVRRIGADLAALGARVWIDEAELNIGDSLLATISSAIDQMDYLLVVLSPDAVVSNWVQQELEQAMSFQLADNKIKTLPVLYRECDIPSYLKGKKYADFTKFYKYEESLAQVARAIGLGASKGEGGTLYDPYAKEFGRQSNLYSRPQRWFCAFCGNGPMPSYNDYMCTNCNKVRPFMGGSATMKGCPKCRQMNLILASYCEWCGVEFK